MAEQMEAELVEELIEELKLKNYKLKDDAELFKAQKRMGLRIASVGLGVGFLFGLGQLGWAPCDQDSGRYTVSFGPAW